MYLNKYIAMLNGHTLENTFVVADFDRTITHGHPGAETAFNVFGSAPGTHPDMLAQRKALFEKYRPIEIDEGLDPFERLKHMRDWHDISMEIIAQYIDEARLQEIISHATQHIQIRSGIKEFFDFLSQNNVPLIIFSAGVSNVIEGVLQHHAIPFDAIHANTLGFVNAKTILINEGVFIGKKNWSSLPNDIHTLVAGKTHKIILGDSLSDLEMKDPERQLTSIGFLLSEHQKKGDQKRYEESFTHVIESDTCDRGFLSQVQKILKNRA